MLTSALTVWCEEGNSRTDERNGINSTNVTGLTVGERIPNFRAKDQNGELRDFTSIRGPRGAVIYFYRSASW